MPVWGEALIFGLCGMMLLVVIGMPIAFGLGLIGLCGFAFFAGPQLAFDYLGIVVMTTPANYLLASVPLFVLMAQLLMVTKVGERMFDAVGMLLSGLPGSLAVATNAAGTLLAAVMGSSAASTATVGHIALPEMKKRGYSNFVAAGAVVGAGGLSVIIPPSVTAIIYSYVMELSVLKMFAGGIIPGVLLGTGYMAIGYFTAILRPRHAPWVPALPLGRRLRGGVHALPVILLIMIVLGSMYGGLASVTESAALGVIGAFLIGMLYHWHAGGKWQELVTALRETAITTGFVLQLVIGAVLFSQFWVYTGVTRQFAEFLLSADLSAMQILIISNIVLIVLGCLMDTLSLLIVVVPIFAHALVLAGFDPIWLGTIYLLNMELALITPPIGFNLFVMKGLGDRFGISFSDIVKGAIPYVAVDLVVLALVIAFPNLVLWPVGLLT